MVQQRFLFISGIQPVLVKLDPHPYMILPRLCSPYSHRTFHHLRQLCSQC